LRRRHGAIKGETAAAGCGSFDSKSKAGFTRPHERRLVWAVVYRGPQCSSAAPAAGRVVSEVLVVTFGKEMVRGTGGGALTPRGVLIVCDA